MRFDYQSTTIGSNLNGLKQLSSTKKENILVHSTFCSSLILMFGDRQAENIGTHVFNPGYCIFLYRKG